VEDGTPATTEPAVGSLREPAAHLGVEVLALGGRCGDVPGEGAEQSDLALGVVVDGPVEVLHGDHLEQAGGLDLLRLLRQLPRGGAPLTARPPRWRRRPLGCPRRSCPHLAGRRGRRPRSPGDPRAAAQPPPADSGVQGRPSARRWPRPRGRRHPTGRTSPRTAPARPRRAARRGPGRQRRARLERGHPQPAPQQRQRGLPRPRHRPPAPGAPAEARPPARARRREPPDSPDASWYSSAAVSNVAASRSRSRSPLTTSA
jgi:hypothetical protein